MPLHDGGNNDPSELMKVVSELDKLMEKGSVFLHCREGRSRSVVIAAMWMSRTLKYSFDQALRMVKRRHKAADPNPELVKTAEVALKGA